MSPSIIRYLLPGTTHLLYRKHPKHSTVQHSAVNPRNKQQSKYAPIRARQRKASRWSWLAPACRRAYRLYSSLCSRNERRNRNLLGLQKYCWWCDARSICLYTCCFSPSFLFRPYIHAASGLFSGTHVELLAYVKVAILHRKAWTSPCDSVVRILLRKFFCERL